MARSSAWQRRNDRAAALGYGTAERSPYYDYRAHDNGRIPPGEAPLRGEGLARARGHRGASDLDRLLKSGDVELVNVIRTGPTEKEILITRSDGSTQTFTLKGEKAITKTRDTLAAMGGDAPQVEGSDESLRDLIAGMEDAAEAAAEAAALEEMYADELEAEAELEQGSLDDDIPF